MRQTLKTFTKHQGKLAQFNSEIPDGISTSAYILEVIAAVKKELPGCRRVLCLVPPKLEQIELFPELRGVGQ